MRKGTLRKSAAILVLALAVSGCGQKQGGTLTIEETTEKETETTKEETTEEETLSPEQRELAKYNAYVELNNDIITVLDNIRHYYEVVENTEEFTLIPDSGYTYGYRLLGLNTDIVEDCLALSDMEPAYETMDPLVKEMAGSLTQLMDAFSDAGHSNDYADNQYQKAKDLHAVIYKAAQEFEPLAYEYLNALNDAANEAIAKEEEKMKAEGRLIAYNASHGITIAGQIIDECDRQGVWDSNITDLDLTNIKPLYEELVATVNDLNAATTNNDQMIKESMSTSYPFDQLYERMIQALEWMIKQVESGKPIEDPNLEPLGSIAHFSNTLSDCVDRYNSVIAE